MLHFFNTATVITRMLQYAVLLGGGAATLVALETQLAQNDPSCAVTKTEKILPTPGTTYVYERGFGYYDRDSIKRWAQSGTTFYHTRYQNAYSSPPTYTEYNVYEATLVRYAGAARPSFALDDRVSITGARFRVGAYSDRFYPFPPSVSIRSTTAPWSLYSIILTTDPAPGTQAGWDGLAGAQTLAIFNPSDALLPTNLNVVVDAAQAVSIADQLRASTYDGVKIAFFSTDHVADCYGPFSVNLFIQTSAVPVFTATASSVLVSATENARVYALSAAVMDPDDSSAGAVTLRWEKVSGMPSVTFSGNQATVSGGNGPLIVRCVATDRDGLEATSEVQIDVPEPPTAQNMVVLAGFQLVNEIQCVGLPGPSGSPIASYRIERFSTGLVSPNPSVTTNGLFTLIRNNNGLVGDQFEYTVLNANNMRSASARVMICYTDLEDVLAGTTVFSPLLYVPNADRGLPRNPLQTSADPIRYATGDIVMNEEDLDASDGGLGHRRSYSNRFADPLSRQGGGWTMEQLPVLMQTTSAYIVAFGGGSQAVFSKIPDADGSLPSKSVYPAKLLVRGDDLAFADPSGVVLLFHGHGTGVADILRGRMQRRYSPNGDMTKVIYDNLGVATSIGRYEAGHLIEEIVYDYLNGRISRVERYRVLGETRNLVRSSEYEYYGTAVGDFGESGQLKLVSVMDSAGAVLRQFHYRYYKNGDSTGPRGVMKYAFGPRALARIKASGIADPVAASDGAVSGFADKYFECTDANDALRVTKQVMLGREVDASGTFTYAYAGSAFADAHNNWKTRTTETNPDLSQTIVYSNFRGEILLRVKKASSGAAQAWIEAYKYDDQGRVVAQATPTAVVGYDETRGDLVGWGEANGLVRDTVGLINWRKYYTSLSQPQATSAIPGAIDGRIEADETSVGENGPRILVKSYNYLAHANK